MYASLQFTVAWDHLVFHNRTVPSQVDEDLWGVSRWFTPLACGPGSPGLTKSYMEMASKLFTFTGQHHASACMDTGSGPHAACGALGSS